MKYFHIFVASFTALICGAAIGFLGSYLGISGAPLGLLNALIGVALAAYIIKVRSRE